MLTVKVGEVARAAAIDAIVARTMPKVLTRRYVYDITYAYMALRNQGWRRGSELSARERRDLLAQSRAGAVRTIVVRSGRGYITGRLYPPADKSAAVDVRENGGRREHSQ